MDIRDPELISVLSNECDVLIHSIKYHENGYVDLTYDFNYTPKSLDGAHTRKKSNIYKSINEHVDKKSYKVIRIYNKELSKSNIKAHDKKEEKKHAYMMERGEINNGVEPKKTNRWYMPNINVNCAMPTKKTYIDIIDKNGHIRTIESNEHVTVNGSMSLYMNTISSIGLPYGPIARQITSYGCTQSIINDSKRIYLGPSFTGFMKRVGYEPTGGVNGNIARFKDQLTRLSACQILAINKSKEKLNIKGFRIINECCVSYDSDKDRVFSEEDNYFEISDELFSMFNDSAVPYDKDVMNQIKSNSLMVDIYIWITYRCHNNYKRTAISWENIILQFGSNYQRDADFKINFMKTIEKLNFYIVTGIKADKKKLYINPKETTKLI